MKLQRFVKGFTLIELLVVIAIIGVLSTLAVVSLNSARQKSRDTSRVSNIKQMQNALEMYFNENDTYPLQAGSTLEIAAIGEAMVTVPISPKPADGKCDDTTNKYIYQSIDSAKKACGAVATDKCSGYYIQFCLGAKTGNVTTDANGLACATQGGITAGPCVWGI